MEAYKERRQGQKWEVMGNILMGKGVRREEGEEEYF